MSKKTANETDTEISKQTIQIQSHRYKRNVFIAKKYLLLGAAQGLLHGADLALARQHLLHAELVAARARQVRRVAARAVGGGQLVCQLHASLGAGDNGQDGRALRYMVENVKTNNSKRSKTH